MTEANISYGPRANLNCSIILLRLFNRQGVLERTELSHLTAKVSGGKNTETEHEDLMQTAPLCC